MKVFRSLKNACEEKWGIVAIGVFDGVHLGHRKIIQRAVKEATNLKLPSGVMTFSPHPDVVLKKQPELVEIYPVRERIKIFKELGVDMCVVVPFTIKFSELSPQEFVEGVLKNKLRCKGVVVGENFIFGKGGKAGVNELKKLCKASGIKAHIVKRVSLNNQNISSSNIRQLLKEGNVVDVSFYLKSPYFLEGKIITGRKIGRKLGFPTINIVPNWKTELKEGVYAGIATYRGKIFPSVIHWGKKPTLNDFSSILEVHFLDTSIEIKNTKTVRVKFLKFLRGVKKFKDLESLKRRIQKDVKDAKIYFNIKFTEEK